MSILDSLTVDVFGLSIVFAVLVALSLVIKFITKIVSRVQKNEHETEKTPQEAQPQPANQTQYADGELRLYDVDEKTAALIMAIVSDESDIPLPQLQFKSIRLMK